MTSLMINNEFKSKENVIGPTTGACAAAAATAAIRFFFNKKYFEEITITLPCGQDWTFNINNLL